MQGRKTINVSGRKFGNLQVIGIVPTYVNGRAHWQCKCSCGIETKMRAKELLSGHKKSCGHLQLQLRRNLGKRTKTHGDSSKKSKYHKLFMLFYAAKQRCTNPNNKQFHDYGARGIKFHFESYEQFKKLFAKEYIKHLENNLETILDRKDNNKGYFPTNCRFVTRKISNNNRRNVK